LAWLRTKVWVALMGEILDAFLTAFDADNTKRCAKCWRYLPHSEFKRDARTKNQLSYRCLDCLGLHRRKNWGGQLVRRPEPNAVETHTSTIDHHGDL
jgi:hypothetical protein